MVEYLLVIHLTIILMELTDVRMLTVIHPMDTRIHIRMLIPTATRPVTSTTAGIMVTATIVMIVVEIIVAGVTIAANKL